MKHIRCLILHIYNFLKVLKLQSEHTELMFTLTFMWVVGLTTLVLTCCRLDICCTDNHRIINAAMHLYFLENYEEMVRHHRIHARPNLTNESERQEINDQWKETLGLEKLNTILKKFEDHWLFTLDVDYKSIANASLDDALHKMVISEFAIRIEKLAKYYRELSSNSEIEIFEKKTVKITSLKDIEWHTTFRDLMPSVVEHLIFETGFNLEMALHSIMYGPLDTSLRFKYCDDISAFKQYHYQPFAIKSVKLCKMLTRHIEWEESNITRVIKELVLTSFEPSKVPLKEILELMNKFKERGELKIRSTPNKFLHNIGLDLLLVDNSDKNKLLMKLKKKNPACFK